MDQERAIYKAWDSVVAALTPAFQGMSDEMLQFFSNEADYTPCLRELAAAVKSDRRIARSKP